MSRMPATHSLKSREKGQKLTLGEKAEINMQITKGIPLRDIKETYQVSLSTIKYNKKWF